MSINLILNMFIDILLYRNVHKTNEQLKVKVNTVEYDPVRVWHRIRIPLCLFCFTLHQNFINFSKINIYKVLNICLKH